MERMKSLPLPGRNRNRFSVARLRHLYADLLQRIIVKDVGGRRRADEERVEGIGHHPFSLSHAISLRERGAQGDSSGNEDGDDRPAQRRRDLAAAFRVLAATRSADKEGGNLGAVAVRDDASASALAMAKSSERIIVNIIRSIGEVVVNAELQPPPSPGTPGKALLRDDPVFEYWCEKSILSLFVDIVREKPSSGSSSLTNSSCFQGAVWSPAVKAQVLRTVSLLVSGVRDASALYYILSQNCVNRIITCILPLQQWTDPALELMLPAYVDLLKNLALILGGSPQLFPFFTVQDDVGVSFPLFSAIMETMTSAFAQSNSFVHASCLNLIVDTLQIEHPPIQAWVRQAEGEQLRIAEHLSHLLVRRYRRMADLTTGPVVDAIRSGAVDVQLAGLLGQIDALNDVFWCSVRGLNVRLCETLLRRVACVLLNDLLPLRGRPFLSVGVVDADVIPDREALAQVSCYVLTRLFLQLEYDPFVRMLAVALFHPKSTDLWNAQDPQALDKEYALTPALNALVEGTAPDAIDNPFRAELVRALRGDYGEWRAVSAAMVVESAVDSESLDLDTLTSLRILARGYDATSIETALSSFLEREHERASVMSTVSLECASSLAIRMLCAPVERWIKGGSSSRSVLPCEGKILSESPVWKALVGTRSYFYRRTLVSQEAMGVSDMFVDLVEAAVRSRYRWIGSSSSSSTVLRGVTVRSDDGPCEGYYAYPLSRYGCGTHGTRAETVLVRKLRGVDWNDVEATRFHAQMALHFRAVCRVLRAFFVETTTNLVPGLPASSLSLNLLDEAGELSNVFGSVRERPAVGTDLDLRGRMVFPFTTESNGSEEPDVSSRRRQVSNGRRMRSFSDGVASLALVLDPTDMFLVRPSERSEVIRGTVLCCVALLDVIAAAVDAEWLHVAVRHEDVEFLIKNGNMALRLESSGTSLIVKQYFDRCRQIQRRELLQKIKALFADNPETQTVDTGDGEIGPSELVVNSARMAH